MFSFLSFILFDKIFDTVGKILYFKENPCSTSHVELVRKVCLVHKLTASKILRTMEGGS